MKFEFIRKSLFIEIKGKKILAIADLHIGWEEAMNAQGVLFPRHQFKEIMEDFEKIFKILEKRNIKLDKVVIVGDLKHEFGRISYQEWSEVEKILEFLKKKTKEIVLIKGNHDKILGPITSRKELKVADYIFEEGVCFLHGNKIFPECLGKKVKLIILGHMHPAVVLHDDYKQERYKCFLVGKLKNKKVIILPSFFPFIEGKDIVDRNKGKLFISEKELKEFEVYVIGEEVYKFGKLKNINQN